MYLHPQFLTQGQDVAPATSAMTDIVDAAPEPDRRGAILAHSGVLPNGEPVSIRWKATLGEGMVKWELRRILPSVGYHETSAWTSLSSLVRDQYVKWVALWSVAGFEQCGMFGRSRHSERMRCLQSPEAVETDCEQEFWLSTEGVIMTLLFWRDFRRQHEMKQLCTAALRLFLEKTNGDDLCSLNATGWRQGGQKPCDKAVNAHGECGCVRKVRYQLGELVGSMAEMTANALFLLSKNPDCIACCGRLMWLVKLIASTAMARVDRWAITDLLEERDLSMIGRTGKKRRMDHHVMEMAVNRQDSQSGQSLTVGIRGVSRQSAEYWVEARMAEIQAATHLNCMASAGVVSSAFDGVRLGKPAQEILMHIVWSSRTVSSSVLPPAVASV